LQRIAIALFGCQKAVHAENSYRRRVQILSVETATWTAALVVAVAHERCSATGQRMASEELGQLVDSDRNDTTTV
jgi:hypothetical protein